MQRQSAIFFLLFLAACHGLIVGPAIYEQKDFGNRDLHQFTYSLSVDCNASVINAVIYNESNGAVGEANVLLSYIDFAQPLLRNTLSDKDGLAVLRLPGQVTLMRGMFILAIQKKGFMNKEVHFDLYPCFHGGALPPKPAKPPPPKPNVSNATYPSGPPVQKNTSNPPTNVSGNKTNQTAPPTGNATGDGVFGIPACPGAFFIGGGTVLFALAAARRKR